MSEWKDSKRKRENWIASLGKDVADDLMLECQLFALAFAAGVLDATTFPDYSVFVSNQTGNTALLAVGALGLSNVVALENVAFSLSFFIIGGMLFGQIGDRLGRRRKAWLIVTNILQTAIMGGATALREWSQKNHGDDSPFAWPVIAFLAFASGGQVAMARTVNLPQIPTAMVTSAYIDIFTDSDITKCHNRPRNRRVVFVIFLIAGSFAGAGAYASVEPALSLLIATLCKTLVCISFLFNRPVPGAEINEDKEPTIQEAAPPEQVTNPV